MATMWKKGVFALALVAATLTTVAGQAKTTSLQPFTSINVCLPFNVVIGALSTPTYQMIVDADPGVADAIVANVTNGSLTLSIAGNQPNQRTFTAPNLIKVAIQLPADQLASVAISSVPSIMVAVDQGFAVPALSLSLSGTSTIAARGVQAQKLQVVNAGTGTIYVAGKVDSAMIASSGTGTTYVIGVGTAAAVDASGISKVFIGGTAQTQITGQVSGISNVYYDQGVCTIGSQFGGIFGAPCTQQPMSPPASLGTPQWSCALTMYGTFGCSDGTTSSSNGGSRTSSSSSSSGSGGGQTMTSQTINGVTTTSTGSNNPDGSSVLNTNTGTLQSSRCNITGPALNIFQTA